MQRFVLVATRIGLGVGLLVGLPQGPAAGQEPARAQAEWSRRGQMSQGLPDYDASAPDAPPVTGENVLDRERFWPYRVELVKDWSSPDGRTVRAGTAGVLVRVEEGGKARIDFGRDGLHEVPLGATNVVRLADAVRRGEERKIAPNLVHVIGPRLGDSASEQPGPYRLSRAAEGTGFLSVYADPAAEGFEELARTLEPLRGREGVLTVLFPQGRHTDADVRDRLRALDWEVPFVLDHFSEVYTRSQLEGPLELPAVQLQTPEGRVLLRSTWHDGLSEEIAASLERAFGDAQGTASLDGE